MHDAWGIVSVGIGLIGFGLYFWSIFRGSTRPHVFTWASFALLDGIVFAAQVVKGAGPGSWATALGAIMCALVAVTALRVGHVQIARSDWVAFIGALVGIVLWVVSKDPLGAVVLAAVVNLVSAYPTLRKSYEDPRSESVTIWSIDILRYLASLFALNAVSVTTALFPISVIVANAAIVLTVFLRRQMLRL